MSPDFSDLMGVPFVDGGRDPKAGLDCWGLLMEVCSRIGYDVPDFTVSCFDTSEIGELARIEMARQLEPAETPAPGAVVTMALDPEAPDEIQHFGVCINNRRFIHTTKETGVIKTMLSHRFWGRKIKGFYHWKK